MSPRPGRSRSGGDSGSGTGLDRVSLHNDDRNSRPAPPDQLPDQSSTYLLSPDSDRLGTKVWPLYTPKPTRSDHHREAGPPKGRSEVGWGPPPDSRRIPLVSFHDSGSKNKKN